MDNNELKQLRKKYLCILEQHQRLLKLLKMEQENTQKFIKLFEEGQKHNCKLKQKIELMNENNKPRGKNEYRQ